jgi:hypothetical protein
MKTPSLGSKPSSQHIVWMSGRGDQTKRFHEDYLRKWCRHFDFDFETYSRVDHERADEARKQYQVVFSYASGGGDDFDFGGEEWSIETGRVPRTFVEIDEEGAMRLRGWSIEKILDVEELYHRGPELIVEAVGESNRQRFDARKLTR